jgi:uridine kinase
MYASEIELPTAVSLVFQHAVANKVGQNIYVVSVAGCSRTGKTTFTQSLQQKFIDEGRKATIVQLDQWIIPAFEREKISTVTQRFNVQKIKVDLESLLAGNVIVLNDYQSQTRNRSEISRALQLSSDTQFVIIEGVVALLDPCLRSFGNLRVFIDVTNLTRLKRLISLYRDFKHLNSNEYRMIIRERENEEVKAVLNSSNHADLIFRIVHQSKSHRPTFF